MSQIPAMLQANRKAKASWTLDIGDEAVIFHIMCHSSYVCVGLPV